MLGLKLTHVNKRVLPYHPGFLVNEIVYQLLLDFFIFARKSFIHFL